MDMIPGSRIESSNPDTGPVFRARGLGERFHISAEDKRETFLATCRRLLTGATGCRELWALRYVLELPAGAARRYGLKEGQRLSFDAE